MNKNTAEWVRKAERDHRVAEQLAQNRPPENDVVCFHCQQAAEKYLKAFLNEFGLAIAKTHNLGYLFDELFQHFPALKGQRRSLRALTKYTIDVRYPGKHTRKREAETCLRWAGRARATCREFLGMKVP